MNVALEKSWREATRRLAETGEKTDPSRYVAAIRSRKPGRWPGEVGLYWWPEAPLGPAEAQNRSETGRGAEKGDPTQTLLEGYREAERTALGEEEASELIRKLYLEKYGLSSCRDNTTCSSGQKPPLGGGALIYTERR